MSYRDGPSWVMLADQRCEWCRTFYPGIEGVYLPADGAVEWECDASDPDGGVCGYLNVTKVDLEDPDV